MKSLIILCVLLGYVYAQVDGNSVLSEINELNYANRQGWVQALTYLSKMSSITNKVNDSVFAMYTAEKEYFEHAIMRIKKLTSKSEIKSKDLINCTAAINEAKEYLYDIPILSIVEAFDTCFDNFLKNITKLEITAKENVKKKTGNFDVDEYLMYQIENSLRIESLELESVYIECTDTKLSDSFQNSTRIQESLLIECVDIETNEKSKGVEVSTDLSSYEDETALIALVESALVRHGRVVDKATEFVNIAHAEHKKYIKHKISQRHIGIEELFLNTKFNFLTKQCTDDLNNVIDNIQSVVWPLINKNSAHCYNEFRNNSQVYTTKLDGNPVDLLNSIGAPKIKDGWNTYMHGIFHVTERSDRKILTDLTTSYFKCIKENADHLEKFLNANNH